MISQNVLELILLMPSICYFRDLLNDVCLKKEWEFALWKNSINVRIEAHRCIQRNAFDISLLQHKAGFSCKIIFNDKLYLKLTVFVNKQNCQNWKNKNHVNYRKIVTSIKINELFGLLELLVNFFQTHKYCMA